LLRSLLAKAHRFAYRLACLPRYCSVVKLTQRNHTETVPRLFGTDTLRLKQYRSCQQTTQKLYTGKLHRRSYYLPGSLDPASSPESLQIKRHTEGNIDIPSPGAHYTIVSPQTGGYRTNICAHSSRLETAKPESTDREQ